MVADPSKTGSPQAQLPMTDNPGTPGLSSDWRIASAVWPSLLASILGLLPFTVLSTYLVPIAASVGHSDAMVGALRGLGGIGTVVVGVAIAPLIGPIAPHRIAAAALVLLAAASVLATWPRLVALTAFALLIGGSNALLYPALATTAADRFGAGPDAVRAATLVTAAKTLAATLAAVVVAGPAFLWGWRGDLLAIAVLAVLMIPLLRGRYHGGAQDNSPHLGYLAAMRAITRVPGALLLVLASFGQGAAFNGYLAYLAPFYSHRFGLTPTVFALVWTLSGGSFFLGNLIAGRVLTAVQSQRRAGATLVAFMIIALVAVFGVLTAPTLPLALLATAVLSASQAVGVAAVVTLLVRRSGDLRGTALSVNAASTSMGLFVGTAVGGLALAASGYPGAYLIFAGFTLIAVGAAIVVYCRTELGDR